MGKKLNNSESDKTIIEVAKNDLQSVSKQIQIIAKKQLKILDL